jgi:hypothetical protein
MQGLSKTQRSAMPRIGLTLGVGTLGALTIAHNLNAAAAIVIGAGAALASIVAALPGIIRAKAEAEVTVERMRQRTLLIEAGLGCNLGAAMDLLKLQPFDADVVRDPRFGEELLRALLPDPRGPCEPDPGPAVRPAVIEEP